MPPTLSLLDWITIKLGQPRGQRIVRFGLAALAAAWGAADYLANGSRAVGAYGLLVIALALAAWGLSVRGATTPAPELPSLSLGSGGAEVGRTADKALERETAARFLRGFRLPSALLVALVGQAMLIYAPKNAMLGAALLLVGALFFVAVVWADGLLGVPKLQTPAAEVTLNFRWWLLAVAVFAGAYGFYAAGDNTFRAGGVLAWIVSVAAWLASLWDWQRSPREWAALARQRLAASARAESLDVHLTRAALLFGLVLLVGAYFRFAQLDSLPPEMTSDHVEKLFDVNDLLNGKHTVFFERNTGREPLQFYFAAFLINVFNTGLTHLTLKLTSAIAGFLMLPIMYLLGRELEDRLFGLLAMLLTGISFWATAISRVGLRFPLTPLFAAAALLFVLRGVRRSSRNDFLLAGLFLGIGLYGYSTIRLVPVALAAALVWFWLWPQSGASRRQLAANTVLMFATTFVVFLPLYRYAIQPDNIFWYRSFSRLTNSEQAIAGSPLAIFLQNNWNALRMFNYLGDPVWVNGLPGKPVLDLITGALFVTGVVFLLLRQVLRRDRVAGALLLLIPLLLLPSTLSIAFPNENPSVVRGGAAIPVVMLIAAYPAWLLLRRLRQVWPAGRGAWIPILVMGALLGIAGLVNRDMYFFQYPQAYLRSGQNASEIGVVVHDFANSFGSYDRAWICLQPHWADTRAVGIYAGKVGWEQVMPPDQFTSLMGDPRPLLVILNPRGQECIAAMRADFPTGRLSVVHSARGADKDFLVYFVPGTDDLDESTLPQP
jgi:uncharacterized membrane protein